MVFMACVSETVSQVHPNLLIFKHLQPYSGTVPTNYLSALFFPDIKWKWLLLSFVFFTCLVSVTTLNTFRRFQKASHTNLKKKWHTCTHTNGDAHAVTTAANYFVASFEHLSQCVCLACFRYPYLWCGYNITNFWFLVVFVFYAFVCRCCLCVDNVMFLRFD